MEVFIVENAKTARQFIKSIDKSIDFNQVEVFELDKHQENAQTKEIESILKQYQNIGLLSEAGMPCIADPGNIVVQLAHQLQVKVKPTVGPSSILLALIASGFNGQNFSFVGYLPIKTEERKMAILKLEKEAQKSTQLLIEAPYRNQKLFTDFCNLLNPKTKLMIAFDLTGKNETILVKTIENWRKQNLELEKHPCIFGVYHP